MKKLAVVLIAGLISATASATNWVLVTAAPSVYGYVDADSIGKSGAYKTAFVRYDYSGYLLAGNQPYNSLITLQQFSCRTNPVKYKALSFLARNNGRLVAEYDTSDNTKWDIIYPGSLAHNVSSFVCSR